MTELAGGSLVFFVVLVLFLVGVIISLYTRKGSGMDHHPYRHVYGGAPGAALPCDDFSGSDRTSMTEREVVARWSPVQRDRRPTTSAEQPRKRVDQLPIRPPVAPPRRPC